MVQKYLNIPPCSNSTTDRDNFNQLNKILNKGQFNLFIYLFEALSTSLNHPTLMLWINTRHGSLVALTYLIVSLIASCR
jgi:uncharacterized membrane protein